MDLNAEPPYVELGIDGNWEGYSSKGFSEDSSSFIEGVRLKKGCGCIFQTPNYELIFEIQSDTISEIRAWAAVRSGIYRAAGLLKYDSGCK